MLDLRERRHYRLPNATPLFTILAQVKERSTIGEQGNESNREGHRVEGRTAAAEAAAAAI